MKDFYLVFLLLLESQSSKAWGNTMEWSQVKLYHSYLDNELLTNIDNRYILLKAFTNLVILFLLYATSLQFGINKVCH